MRFQAFAQMSARASGTTPVTLDSASRSNTSPVFVYLATTKFMVIASTAMVTAAVRKRTGLRRRRIMKKPTGSATPSATNTPRVTVVNMVYTLNSVNRLSTSADSCERARMSRKPDSTNMTPQYSDSSS